MVRVELCAVLLSVPQFVFLSGRQVIVCPRVEDGQAPSHADSDASVAFAVFPIFGGSGLLFGGGAALYADRRALEKDMRERESTQRRGHASGDHEEHLVLVRYRIHYIRIQSVNRSPPRFVCSESTLVRSGARIFFYFSPDHLFDDPGCLLQQNFRACTPRHEVGFCFVKLRLPIICPIPKRRREV